MKVINSPAEMTAWARTEAGVGRRICLVPTMGCFHEGHLRLMRLARGRAEIVVVSLFVNPLQFGPREDFAAYPRDFARDSRLAAEEGVDVIFSPSSGEMYPAGFQTVVRVGSLTRHLCGASRPGHFDGVATVVNKLFAITRADCAVFGEKDFQQLAVIRRMAADLNMNIEIIGHPIVREADGLAMSSRNLYLGPDERPAALSLYQSIQLARKAADRGELRTEALAGLVREHIESFAGTEIDYVSFVDGGTLEPVAAVDGQTLLALAVRINGKVRLIDNGFMLGADRGW
ncbi:MAG TPA: pantoate--beta-alanine ligase [Desulfobulbaceae bacterium]|nr:pantoate--beta-alanine ligase [Desulfobulbaceae bacterium]